MGLSYAIRNLREEEIRDAIELATTEGWNPGLYDAEAFYLADPNGFFVGELNGKPIAFISAVNYNQAYGFVGLYIVKKEYRGQGYGYRIWQHAMEQLQNLSCGLDGVPAQIDNYRRSGFVYEFRQMRLATQALQSALTPTVKSLTSKDWERVANYDTSVFGTPRETFIRGWLTMPTAKAYYTEDKGRITGYAVIRKCRDGHKIGPLFADTDFLAEQLFLACHQAADEKETVYIDMPENKEITQTFIEKYRLNLVFETARMYKNGKPDHAEDKVYGVTTFELG